MDPNRLRSLLAIAERGSFSRAAAALGLSQPSLSRQIALLEEEAGAVLLYRHGRGAALTEAGQRLAAAARPVLDGLDGLPGAFRDDAAPRGMVALGIPTSFAAQIAPPLFSEFRARYPLVRLRLMDGFSGYVNQWLIEGRVDAAILYDSRRSRLIGADPLAEERLCLFGRADRAEVLPKGTDVPVSALASLELILPDRYHGLRRTLDRAGGVGDPARVLEVDSLTALYALVEQGIGWSVLPYMALRREAADPRFTVRPLGLPPLMVRLVLATSTSRPVTPATRTVMRFLHEVVAQLSKDGMMSPGALPR